MKDAYFPAYGSPSSGKRRCNDRKDTWKLHITRSETQARSILMVGISTSMRYRTNIAYRVSPEPGHRLELQESRHRKAIIQRPHLTESTIQIHCASPHHPPACIWAHQMCHVDPSPPKLQHSAASHSQEPAHQHPVKRWAKCLGFSVRHLPVLFLQTALPCHWLRLSPDVRPHAD